MTQETNVEETGAGGTPKPPASETSVADAETLSKLVRSAVDEALKPIKGDISGLYSRQDKDRNAFSEFMAEFKKQKAKGLDDDAAESAANSVLDKQKKEQKRDELLELVAKKLGLDSSQPVGNGNGGAVDVAKVASEYGLKADDPEFVAAFSNRKYDNDKDARLDLVTFAYKQATKPQPSDADAASPPSGAPKKAMTQSEIDTKAATLTALYKSPTKNAKQIAILEKELEPYLP